LVDEPIGNAIFLDEGRGETAIAGLESQAAVLLT
jgi:hypothetical protein